MLLSLRLLFFGDWWDERWRRRQQIAYRLGQRPEFGHVLYVETPLTVTSLLKFALHHADMEATWRWKRVLKKGLTFGLTDSNVDVITPLVLRSQFDARGYVTSWQQHRILRCMGGPSEGRVLSMVTHPFWPLAYYQKMGIKDFLYDYTENHGQALPFTESRRREVRDNDLMLSKAAGAIIVQTKAQLEAKRGQNPYVYLVPNGVDYELFDRQADVLQGGIPPELADLAPPIIGYAGSLNYRMDWDLLVYLARERPQWSFVLVGYCEDSKGVLGLKELPNVRFLAEQPYHKLPQLQKQFDVCVIPYRDLPELDVSPIKLFSYLASGKPVVSTPIAGAEEFSEVVLLAGSRGAFLAQIEYALAHDNAAQQEGRRQVARENSWEGRIRSLAQIIKSELDRGH